MAVNGEGEQGKWSRLVIRLIVFISRNGDYRSNDVMIL